jgi:hypothetical protein
VLLGDAFRLESFPHRLNVSLPESDLRIQIRLDSRYAPLVDRATAHDVLGLTLPVAAVEDVLQGKVWAAEDEARRASKRQKDLADIARLMEKYPRLLNVARPAVGCLGRRHDSRHPHRHTHQIFDADTIAGFEVVRDRLWAETGRVNLAVGILDVGEEDIPRQLAVNADRLDTFENSVASTLEHLS